MYKYALYYFGVWIKILEKVQWLTDVNRSEADCVSRGTYTTGPRYPMLYRYSHREIVDFIISVGSFGINHMTHSYATPNYVDAPCSLATSSSNQSLLIKFGKYLFIRNYKYSYVCMCVCIYVSMCMYVCMYVCIQDTMSHIIY